MSGVPLKSHRDSNRVGSILETFQVLMLCFIAFICVISSPRQLLLLFSQQASIPLEFRMIALSLPDYFIIALVILSVLRLAVDRNYRERILETFNTIVTKGGVWWVALIVWIAAGILWALQPIAVRYQVLDVTVGLMMAVVLAELVRERGGRSILYAFLLGAVVQSIVAILQVVNRNPIGLYALGEIQRFSYDLNSFYRAPGLSMHPNYLGGYLLIALFVCILIAHQNLQRLNLRLDGPNHIAVARAIALPLVVGSLTGIGLIGTLSRSAMLALLIGGGVLLVALLGPTRPRTRLIAGGLVILVALAGAGWGWFALGGDIQTRIFSSREFFFADTFEVIKQSPILGVGAGNLMLQVERNHPFQTQDTLPVHNVYLFIWAELGLPGLALFALGCLSILWRLRSSRDLNLFIWGSCFLAICVIMLFDNYFWAVIPFRDLFFCTLGLWWGYVCQDQVGKPALAAGSAALLIIAEPLV